MNTVQNQFKSFKNTYRLFKGCLISERLLFQLFFLSKSRNMLFLLCVILSTSDSLQHIMNCSLIFYSDIAAGTQRDVLPTQAPCLKDMRGQKMLWTSWDPCWMGKLLFSCSVPSLSTTLPTPRRHNWSDSVSQCKSNILENKDTSKKLQNNT